MKTSIFKCVLMLAVSSFLFACSDIGERDNPVDPKSDEYSGYDSGDDPDRGSSGSYVKPSSVTKGIMTDSRDGQTYKTVTIGEQTWMAENLNYAYNEPTMYLDSSSFCYNNSADSCSKYGRLYLWSAAMDSAAVFSDDGEGCGDGITCSAGDTVRGVCPEGWHLPSEDEWSTLFTAVGGTSTAGTVLKSTSGWYSNGNGEDSFGFSVLPAGSCINDGYFGNAGLNAYFWSSPEDFSDYAYGWDFFYDYAIVDEGSYSKFLAFSVRCVRNSVDEGSEASSSSSQAQPSSSSSINDASEYDASANTLTDLRDGQTYKTVTIGSQTWMAENLNYAYNESTAELDSSSFCYNNEPDSCAKYGRLYMWSAAMDSAAVFSDDGMGCGYEATCSSSEPIRGACPKGWHLPSIDEWSTLFATVGGISSAGTMLKSTSGWRNDGNGEDSFGFSVLPAGYRYYYNSFYNVGENAFFWSSTKSSGYANCLIFDYNGADVSEEYASMLDPISVRCVMN